MKNHRTKLNLLPRSTIRFPGHWRGLVAAALLLYLGLFGLKSGHLLLNRTRSEQRAEELNGQLPAYMEQLHLVDRLHSLQTQQADLEAFQAKLEPGIRPSDLMGKLQSAQDPGMIWQSFSLSEKGKMEAGGEADSAASVARTVQKLELDGQFGGFRIVSMDVVENGRVRVQIELEMAGTKGR